jgi:hypothetical protein
MQGQLSKSKQPIAAAILSPYCGPQSSTTLRSNVLGKMKIRCSGKEGALPGRALAEVPHCPLASLAGVSGSDFPSVATLLLQRGPTLAAPFLPVSVSDMDQLHTAAYARLHSHLTLLL